MDDILGRVCRDLRSFHAQCKQLHGHNSKLFVFLETAFCTPPRLVLRLLAVKHIHPTRLELAVDESAYKSSTG